LPARWTARGSRNRTARGSKRVATCPLARPPGAPGTEPRAEASGWPLARSLDRQRLPEQMGMRRPAPHAVTMCCKKTEVTGMTKGSLSLKEVIKVRQEAEREGASKRGKGTEMVSVPELRRTLMQADGMTVGLDLGDKVSSYCLLSAAGEVLEEGVVRTQATDLVNLFARLGKSRLVMEAGTHSPWISRLLREQGHEVLVANPTRLALISKGMKKTDRMDAQTLARLGRLDPGLLSPIEHRSEQEQKDLSVLKSRVALVQVRTKLINELRGSAKSQGKRLSPCDADVFHEKLGEEVAEKLPDLVLVMTVIRQTTKAIEELNARMKVREEQYPAMAVVKKIRGVGPMIAAAFVLTIGDPSRFKRSRDVGSYLGLTPKRRQSGDRDPQLRITKAGDKMTRWLLVQGAQYILGRYGEDCDLRRWGLARLERGGKNAKKRVTVAVARKLAVLMHHLWVNGLIYDPLHLAKKRGEVKEATMPATA
jgi:transposase